MTSPLRQDLAALTTAERQIRGARSARQHGRAYTYRTKVGKALDILAKLDRPNAPMNRDWTPPTNSDRAEWARKAVSSFAAACGQDEEDLTTNAGDLLADLMHLADMDGCSFAEWLRRADDHYTYEARDRG